MLPGLISSLLQMRRLSHLLVLRALRRLQAGLP
jgi:hypothetical protein